MGSEMCIRDSPCEDMTNVVLQSVSDNEEYDSLIKIVYLEKDYQNVQNFKDFGFQSFWSGVGGFVGIFLGYSFMQFPELVGSVPSLVRTLRS